MPLSNGQQFALVTNANAEMHTYNNGNDLALIAVPEPSSAVSVLVGLSGLVGLTRFRRRVRAGV